MDRKIFDVCRACMSNRNDCLNATEFVEMSEKIVEMFTYCTSIQILKEEGLPMRMCLQCTQNVQSCYNFISVCKTSDENLHFYLRQQKETPQEIKFEEEFKTEQWEIKIKTENTYEDNDNMDDNVDAYMDYQSPSECQEDSKDFKKPHKKKMRKLKKEKLKDGVKKIKKKKLKSRLKLECNGDSVSSNKFDARMKYTCPVESCNLTMSSRETLRMHLDVVHKGYKRYPCKHCDKGFKAERSLLKHELTHKSERPFNCDVCGMTFKLVGQLASHKKHHTDDKPFTCDVCLVGFQTKCSLSSHKKLHIGEEANLCHLCGASFAQVGNLKVHMRIHTGEKPYSCSICPYRCSVQSGLKRHERTHANLRAHKCPICHKGFNNRGSLIRHDRIHTGELPYKCDYCPKAFIDNWKRKNHLVKTHNIAMEAIPKLIPGRKRQYTKIKDIEGPEETSENDIDKPDGQ